MKTSSEFTCSGPLQLFHNEDSTQIFYTRQFQSGNAGEIIDSYVDVMADAGVSVFLCNTNSRRTNYRSNVWDAHWDGYDPAGPDDQPFLLPVPRNNVKAYRNLIANMLAVHQQGIDYPARVVRRCRHRGMSPWITLRMNDCHYNAIPAHPFHGSFWRENPQFSRRNCTDYFATCLDYAHPEVRDFFKALIAETLERYDIDGLELDFMRETYLFSTGKEAEGIQILTDWIREIRKLVDAAAAKRDHTICLGVRVPSRPETALGLGLDAITWAREGLIDLLVVTPRWATVEFDMPLTRWRQLLGTAKTVLAGGLEVNYRPWPGASPSFISPELAVGAAVSVLSGGADAVYLFNYFQDGHPHWTPDIYRKTLRAMTSSDSLLKLPRSVGITFRDITLPNENYRPQLPVTGVETEFSINLGPISDDSRKCRLSVEMASPKGAAASIPEVSVNGILCVFQGAVENSGTHLFSYSVPASALTGTAVHNIKVLGKNHDIMKIEQLEMSLEPEKVYCRTTMTKSPGGNITKLQTS